MARDERSSSSEEKVSGIKVKIIRAWIRDFPKETERKSCTLKGESKLLDLALD